MSSLRSSIRLRRRFRTGTGFTLIEMMVAVVIVGVAIAVSMPRIQVISNETKVQRAAQAIQAETQQAFAIAGRNRAPVTLRWNSAALQFQTTNLAGTTVYRRLGLGSNSGYSMDAGIVTVSNSVFTVFPNGLAADTLLVTLSRNGYSRRIRLSRSGMVRVQ